MGWVVVAAAAKATAGPPQRVGPGWTSLATIDSVQARQSIRLDTHGRLYRYYLIWITSLPPGRTNASISDLALFG